MTTNSNSAREAALARRRAMATGGKTAVAATKSAPVRQAAPAPVSAPTIEPVKSATTAVVMAKPQVSQSRAAVMARREMMAKRGKTTPSASAGRSGRERARPQVDMNAIKEEMNNVSHERVEPKVMEAPAPVVANQNFKPKRIVQSSSRTVALARRQSMSNRGKAGVAAGGMTPAQTARAANPGLTTRELAQAVRAERCTKGGSCGGQKRSAPTGRRRPAKGPSSEGGSLKVGNSETSHGQRLTGTMVDRLTAVTGSEPGQCRAVTGTEYMGAEVFRAFCQSEPDKAIRKVGVSPTLRGNAVTGNKVGRSNKVTGDEPGTCKNVTGTEYVGADLAEAFCGTKPQPAPAKVRLMETRKGMGVTGNKVGRSDKVTGDEAGSGRELTGSQYMKTSSVEAKAPAKVGKSTTLRGGSVTGTMVGRNERVTGDEPGTCRNVTGGDYVGQEQYTEFCDTTPMPQHQKVGASMTLKGETVTGTMTGRAGKVTGDEPGTCSAITGTPYAGAEQYRSYCNNEQVTSAGARNNRPRQMGAAAISGIQPGIGGKMTGAEKGACDVISGTPYLGKDQVSQSCAAEAAEIGQPDFPQAIGGQPWESFSVEAPSHAAQVSGNSAVTGTSPDKGRITGPFGMAPGKVTGTEDFRFGKGKTESAPSVAMSVQAPVNMRKPITGEGMAAGKKITGDDWDRGDRVTGTEGTSATRRNPTRQGRPEGAMAMVMANKRNEEVPVPVSKVTGSSGNTEKGSLVTYSGGARG